MQNILRQTAITLCFCTLSFFNVSAQSSTGSGGLSIVAINSLLFEGSNGVTKLTNTQKKAEAEFKPRTDELKTMQAKWEELGRTLKNPSQKHPQSKYDEYEQLNRDIKSKAETYQAQYHKRYNELIRPVYTQMEQALKQWTKQKGYSMVVDISKDEKGMFVWVEESSISQSTMDLINYFNSVIK